MGTGLASRNSCSGRWARLECGSRLRTRTFMETCCWRAAARGLGAAGAAWAARRPGRTAQSGRSGAAPRRLAGRRAGWDEHGGSPGLRAALRSATPASAAGGSLARPWGFCSTGIWTAEFGGRAFRGAECVSIPPPGTLRVRDGEFSVTPSTCPPQSPPAVAVVLKKLLMGPCENWETRDL